ncbi:alpha/beta hydrolase [Halalkalibacter sp. APA_J-10(15)]|uniref:alpha/beta hydrolase n=1 Tax=unclassified Halalkalibacter TaxID=2893063 RepID=UPI001FF1E40B|nr:alpha/beta hydrolase [Halalkalibacter sp. APA_J-10(15)]MCK0472657.1 alpha/beta hydrolase [Halalkalibacter sp. APA_J-10(15)]
MMRDARYQQIAQKWGVTYLPERPNGFAVFLLGDNGIITREDDSDWEIHPEKSLFLTGLLQRGYTVVVPPLHPSHWGSEEDFRIVLHMYHQVLKQEILNSRIHLLAEGTGALLALRWIAEEKEWLRSCYLINPCLDLQAFYRQEQENKWFFKRLEKELAEVYQEDKRRITNDWIKLIAPSYTFDDVPPLSIHCDINEKRFPLHIHSRPFLQKLAELNTYVNLRIHGNEQSFYRTAQAAYPFFKKYEVKL